MRLFDPTQQLCASDVLLFPETLRQIDLVLRYVPFSVARVVPYRDVSSELS